MNTATVYRMLRLAHQTCTISRLTAGAEDPYGQAGPGTWADLATTVRCAAFPEADAGEQFATDRAIIANRYAFYFAGDVDVSERDRLEDLAFRGEVVNTHYFEVVELQRQMPYYIKAIVREVL